MLINIDALGQFLLVEIRPMDVREDEFGIGDLVEEAVGKSLFPGSPDEKIDVPILPSREKLRSEIVEGDFVRIDNPVLRLPRKTFGGGKDLLP